MICTFRCIIQCFQICIKFRNSFQIAALQVAVSANETAITLMWTAPTDCVIDSYSINITDSNTTTLVIPGSQQGHNFSGLKSNTFYSITLAAFYSNNASDIVARNTCTCELVKPVVLHLLDISPFSGTSSTKCDSVCSYGSQHKSLFKYHLECSSMLCYEPMCCSISLSFLSLVLGNTEWMMEVITTLHSQL